MCDLIMTKDNDNETTIVMTIAIAITIILMIIEIIYSRYPGKLVSLLGLLRVTLKRRLTN